MTRPTREQVDAALANSELVYAFSAEEWRVMTVRLAAEVRVLREELKQAYDLANYPDAASFRPDVVFARGYRQGRKEALAEFHGTSVCPGCEHYKKLADMNVYAAEYVDAQEDVDRLEATIARVEALPAKWRATSGDRGRAWECADELEAALKG